jgi:hypothetical protein
MTYYANKSNKYFTKQEALEKVRETIEEGYDGYYCDLHNEAFNTDYYIIGTAEAKKALEEFGVFNAIEIVREYEKMNFGEYYTDVGNPEKLANMLWYIIGEEVIAEIESIGERWDDEADDESNAIVLEEIERLI